MLLLSLVIIGVSVFSFIKGYYLIGVICLLGFSHSIGMLALFITSLYLIYQGHWIVGILPLLLMIWNFIGLKILYKKSVGEKI